MKFFDASRYASPLRKALAKKENAPRNLRFETLENRALLSVTPLDELQAAVASAEIAPAQTVETPVVDLSVLAVSNATAESVVETEPNDAFETAQDLGVLKQETTVSGVANAHLNKDFYKVEFTVAGASGHKITLTNAWVNPVSDKAINLNLYLYAADNLSAPVEQSAKFGVAATTEEISLDGLAAGTYYVEVRQNGAAGSDFDHEYTSPYTLTIVPPAIPQDQYESNDALQTAYNLGVLGETEISAKTGLYQEYDFFKFSTPATGSAADFVEINYTQAANTNIALALFDSVDAAEPIRNITSTATTKTISLEGLPAGDYYVRVYNSDPQANQAVDYALKINAPSVAPVAPTTFQTNGDEATNNYTTLSWNNVFGETGYELEVSVNDGAWTPVATFAADATTSGKLDLAFATKYQYRLRAVNNFGQSDWVELADAFTTVDAPEPPTGLKKASILDPETLTVDLSWTDLKNELGYVVDLLDADGAVVAQSDRLAADTTSWTTPALALGTTYQFQVTAINNAGDATSELFSFTTENVPTVQPVLTATVAPSTTAPTATLKWGAVETATRYVVEQLVVDGETATWTAVQTFENGETEWTTAVEANAAYSYRVVAANAYGSGVPSEAVAFTPDAVSTVVTTLADEVDPSDGEISLREAISYAETGATITFAETLKGGTITLAGTQLEITKGITVDASALYDAENDAPGLTLDANKESRVLYVANGTEETPVALIGLKITGGYVGASSGNSAYGGGAYVYNGVTSFTNCVITDNHLTNNGAFEYVYGGGVYASGVTTFVDTTISNNSATAEQRISAPSSAYGGGVYAAGSPTFTNTTITDNEVYGYHSAFGGGAYVDNASFVNTTISNNSTTGPSSVYGGGVYADNSTFANVKIISNVAQGANAQGGGLSGSTVTIANSLISGNNALGGKENAGQYAYGGGVAGGGQKTFTNTTISNNAAVGFNALGGGLMDLGGGLTLINSAITANLATASDQATSGLHIQSPSVIKNTTIADNNASSGTTSGAVRASGYQELKFYNSIVAQNINGDFYFTASAPQAYAYNTLSGFTGWAPGSTNNYVYDATQPLFKDAADGDYRLADGSQALNKGDNAYVPETLTTDLAGNPRLSGRVDLGAYEFQGVATTAPTGLTATVNPSTAPTATLKWDAVVSDVIAETVAGYEVTLYQIEADGTVVAFEPQTVADATYTTGTLDLGGVYYFEVAAVNAYGKSEVKKSETFTVGNVPTAPTDLNADLDEVALTATLTWVDNASAETGYRVELQIQNADGETVWETVDNLAADAETWSTDVAVDTTYRYRVVAWNAYGETASETVEVVVENVPTAPTGLTADLDEAALTATLFWADNAFNETGYRVELQTQNADGETVWETVDNLDADLETWSTDVDLATTYRYRVVAWNAYGETASETVEVVVENVPTAPTDLAVAQQKYSTVKGTYLRLYWTDASSNETRFRVEVKASDSDEWTFAQNVVADQTNAFFYDLEVGKAYDYRVRAENALGVSDWVETSYAAMAAPTVAVSGYNASTGSLTLALSGDANAKSYRLEVSTVPFDGEKQMSASELYRLLSVKGDATSQVVDGLEPGATYYVRARSERSNGRSDWSEVAIFSALNAPTELTATVDASTEPTATIKWGASETATAYVVTVYDANGEVVETSGEIATLEWTTTAGKLQLGATYSVTVVASNAYGESESTETFTVGNVPTATSDLTATVDETFKATLTWTDNSNNETGFVVSQLVDGQWQEVATVGPDEGTWTTGTLVPGGTYQFRVQAENEYGVANPSTVAVVVALPAPTDLAVSQQKYTTAEGTYLRLYWTDASDAETRFRVEVKSADSDEWTFAQNVDADQTNAYFYDLEVGKEYDYRVRAENDLGVSDWVETSYAAMVAPTVAISSYNESTGSLTLALSGDANAKSYRLEVSTVPFAGEKQASASELHALLSVDGDATSQIVTGLEPGTTYYVRARSERSGGRSAWSEVAVFSATSAPTDLAFIRDASDATQGRLVWTNNSDAATTFRVEISADGVDWDRVLTTPAVGLGQTSLAIDSLTPGQEYYLRVRSENENTVSVWTTGMIFNAPTDLTVSQQKYTTVEGTYLRLYWTDASDAETRFRVEVKSADSGEWIFAQNVAADKTNAFFYDLEVGKAYDYRVRAENDFGVSDWVETSYAAMVAPTVAISSYDESTGSLTLALSGDANAKSYRLEVSTVPFAGEKQTAASELHAMFAIKGDATSQVVTGLEPGTTYYVRARSERSGGRSDWSELLEITLPSETLKTSNAVSEAFAELFADDAEDDFWFELETALGKRK